MEQRTLGRALQVTPDELAEIGEVLANAPVQGARYGEHGMKLVGR